MATKNKKEDYFYEMNLSHTKWKKKRVQKFIWMQINKIHYSFGRIIDVPSLFFLHIHSMSIFIIIIIDEMAGKNLSIFFIEAQHFAHRCTIELLTCFLSISFISSSHVRHFIGEGSQGVVELVLAVKFYWIFW